MKHDEKTGRDDGYKLQYLIDLAYTLNQQNDFNEILRLLGQKTASLLNAEIALILMINPRTHQTVKTIFKEVSVEVPSEFGVLQNQVSGWIIKNNSSLLCSDIKTDARFSKVIFEGINVNSVIGVPLRVEGLTIGTFVLFNKDNQNEFDENDLTYLNNIAVIAAPYLRNVQKIQEFFEQPIPNNTLLVKYKKLGLIGKSQRFIEMLQAVEVAARCAVRVLLEGQSGTGKELIAKAIHKFSARNNDPFVAIDCGAIPQNLLESELFGHARGAFTGANRDRKGLIEEANHGTLFMDEIANLPLQMQVKLMRVLQEGELRPVGSNQTKTVDVRLITASSASLKELVQKQLFREDLYYRLHVYPISVPTLNERREDIPVLANHFLEKAMEQRKIPTLSFHEKILDFMKHKDWQGNIRELENFVERLITLAPTQTKKLIPDILPPDLLEEYRAYQASQGVSGETKPLNEYLEEYEKELILQFLERYNWNQSQTARALRLSERMMRYRMKKLDIKKH